MILTVNSIKEFEMELTGVCNLSCSLCTRNYKHADHMLGVKHRPIKDIIKQLDVFKNLNRVMLAGAVSEPTLYKDFIELIKYLNSRNIFIDLFTNGDTKTPEFWEEVGELFNQGNQESRCTFTVCGTTNASHKKYRIGSSLNNIMKNAYAFKKTNRTKADYVQVIDFEYNKNENFTRIKNKFNNSYHVHSEGRRRLKDFKKPPAPGVTPPLRIEKAINTIFKFRPKPGDSNINIKCNAIKNSKLFMNQYGQLHHCYISAEFNESKDDFLLKDPSTLNEHTLFDFSKVLDFTYPDCFQCSTKTLKLIERSGLDFLC